MLDTLPETFGFRTVEARDGRIYLNGEPVYLRGALDQDYYPDGICTTPSEAFLEDQFRKAKELGLNCVRCHIKVPDPRYYEVADRVGLLVWTELPNVGRLTDAPPSGSRATHGGHPRARRQPPQHRLLDDHQRELGHGPGPRRRAPRLAEPDLPLAQGAGPDAAGGRQLGLPRRTSTSRATSTDFHFYAALPDHRRAWDGFAASFADRARAPSARTATRSAPAASP